MGHPLSYVDAQVKVGYAKPSAKDPKLRVWAFSKHSPAELREAVGFHVWRAIMASILEVLKSCSAVGRVELEPAPSSTRCLVREAIRCESGWVGSVAGGIAF